MLNQYNCIPFSTADLPLGSSLIFSPHPDDETFGMGGSIIKLAENSQIINVVLMTYGDLGGEPSIRKKEFIQAIKELGVSGYTFFGGQDSKIDVSAVNIEKVKKVIQKYKPVNIFFPSPLEYHPDHRNTAWLVWYAIQSIKYTGNVFSYEIANQSPSSMLIDISPVMEKKQKAMYIYESQLKQNAYFDTVTAMNRLRAYTLVKDKVTYAESFFKFNSINFDLMSYYYEHIDSYHQGVNLKKLPLVSVLIRTKDRPSQLKKALESVMRQNYQYLEINILNDGGTCIQKTVNMFNFKRVFIQTHEKSKGKAIAANVLLSMARGEYIIFLDDDDTFDSNHIQNLVTVLRDNQNLLAVYSGIRVGEGINKTPFSQPYNAALLRKKNFIPIHAVLFSCKLLEKGCRFDESFEIYEDWDFWLQVAQKTELYYVDKVSATFNINGDSGANATGGIELKDLNFWTLKLYEKWQHIWNAQQLKETFDELETLNFTQTQDLKKQLIKLYEDGKKIMKDKDNMIQACQKKLENQNTFIKDLNYQVDKLLEEKIYEYDEDYSSSRDFELASSKNYELQCRELFEEVFEVQMTKEFWDWKYINHQMKWHGICVVKNEKVIGHYNGMARTICYFGEIKTAVQISDTMVSSSNRGGFRKNSPFYTMAKMFIELNIGVRKPFFLAFGFPNKRHMLLGEKLGLYSEVDTMTQVQWKINKTSTIDNNFPKYFEIKNFKDNLIEELWYSMSKDFQDEVIGIRNRNYIIRRYVKHPKFDYKVYGIKNDEEKLIAIFVVKQEKSCCLLMDVVAKKENFNLVINGAKKVAENMNVALLKCWCSTSKKKLFDYYKPIMKTLDIAIPLAKGKHSEDIKNKWFLMYGDTDFI